jgi:hypothetical protein
MPKCKCGAEVEELSPEGECFKCSTGDDSEACDVNTKNIRESLHNIAEGLAVKQDSLTSKVQKQMYTAAKDKDRGN